MHDNIPLINWLFVYLFMDHGINSGSVSSVYTGELWQGSPSFALNY